jgi:hypothetical protein
VRRATTTRAYSGRAISVVSTIAEHEVAEDSAAVPAFELRLVHLAPRPRRRIQLERLQPVDACETMTALATRLGGEKMVGERPDVAGAEAERREPLLDLFRPHDAVSRRRRAA